ncbi:MAG: hypothetical protein ACJAZ0_002478, partial [Halioglobus sp.]
MSFRLTLITAFLMTFTLPSQAQNDSLKIEAKQLSRIVKVLASDEFEGRAPGGLGEEKTVSYLIKEFEQLGLEPGGENGGWTQAVPLLRTQIREPEILRF